MRFNNFTSSWVSAVEIVGDLVIIETASNKNYVINGVAMSDRLNLIETLVNNANGDLSASVGELINSFKLVYDITEIVEPVTTRVTASKDRLIFDGETLAYFERGKFLYIGSAASKFFEQLMKEINGTTA